MDSCRASFRAHGHTLCLYKVLTEVLWRTPLAEHSAAVRCKPQCKLRFMLRAQSCAEEHPPWYVVQVLTLPWGLCVYLCDKQVSFHSGGALLPQPAQLQQSTQTPCLGAHSSCTHSAHSQIPQLFKHITVQSHTDTNEEQMRIIWSRNVHVTFFCIWFHNAQLSSSFIFLLVL